MASELSSGDVLRDRRTYVPIDWGPESRIESRVLSRSVCDLGRILFDCAQVGNPADDNKIHSERSSAWKSILCTGHGVSGRQPILQRRRGVSGRD